MKEIEPKVIMSALLPVLLLLFSTLAGAVNFVFYSYQSAAGCLEGGPGIGYFGVGPNLCCTTEMYQGGSVQVSDAGSDVWSKFFIDGGCKYQYAFPVQGNICYDDIEAAVVGGFTGVFWYNGRRRSLLADPTTCDAQMEPNSVIFTEDSTKGHWVLNTSNVDQLYSEMQTVPDAEKIIWLKSRGAIYDQL